jgi:hypothetical protein
MSNEKADKTKDHKEIIIYINGTAKVIQKARLTFDEIIALAFDNPWCAVYSSVFSWPL